ncbi:hypothetical protein F441_21449, partial [Phytophthora nicotianae CJ01A1]
MLQKLLMADERKEANDAQRAVLPCLKLSKALVRATTLPGLPPKCYSELIPKMSIATMTELCT